MCIMDSLGDTLFSNQCVISEQPVHITPVLHMQYQEEWRMTLNNEGSGSNNDQVTTAMANNDNGQHSDNVVNVGPA